MMSINESKWSIENSKPVTKVVPFTWFGAKLYTTQIICFYMIFYVTMITILMPLLNEYVYMPWKIEI